MDDLLQLGNAANRPRPPKADDLELRFSEAAVAELEELKSHYPTLKACALPALWIAQRENGGFLDAAALAETAHRLGRSYAEIEGVATFYSMYNVGHRPGRHKLELCTCLTCSVCGAYRLRDLIRAKLGIGDRETTADGVFTYEEVECLNACDRAPVMQVGDAYVGPLDEAGLDALLARLRATPESTVVQMADEIVRVQLAGSPREGGA